LQQLQQRAKTKNPMANYKFFRQETQNWIDAPEEVWCWEAHYENGQILKQFGDDGIFHQFSEIDQNQLAIFKMTSNNYPQTYSVLFSDPNMKLIHFYRNSIFNAGTDSEERTRFYCFGYEKKVGSKIQKLIMVITPTNELIVTEDPNIL